MMIDTPESINAFRLLALKGALKLECLGMKRRGESASSIVRGILKGAGMQAPTSRQALFGEYETYLRSINVLID